MHFLLQAGIPERKGIGGENNFPSRNFLGLGRAARDLDLRIGAPLDSENAVIFQNLSASAIRGLRQPAHQFSGIERSTLDFIYHPQRSRILPLDRRARGVTVVLSSDFPRALQSQIAIYFESLKSLPQTGQHISQAGLVSSGGF